MARRKVTIVQTPGKEIPTEVLATEIKNISDGIKRMRSGRLNDKALLVLIQHNTPTDGNGRRMALNTIREVVDGIESLERAYLK